MWFFRHFFAPYLFDRSRNNRRYKQPSKFWREKMSRKPLLKLLRWFFVHGTNNKLVWIYPWRVCLNSKVLSNRMQKNCYRLNTNHWLNGIKSTLKKNPHNCRNSNPRGRGISIYKAIQDVPFFKVSFFSLNSWTRYENWPKIPETQTGYDYLLKNTRLLFSLSFCNLKILRQGIEMPIFSRTGCGDSLKNGHLPFILHSSAPLSRGPNSTHQTKPEPKLKSTTAL